MPKLIEIIGSPGSGKTFLCNKLEKVRKNNKQIFFHSSNLKNYKIFKNLNFLTKIFLEFKVFFFIISFCIIFHKRFFYKKIYKKKFFFKVITLLYTHIKCIEYLKWILTDDQYLITEPGRIMYFLQDYFYTQKNLFAYEIKLFNKIFLNVNLIIYVDCNSKLKIKRLNSRTRGLPTRMRELNSFEIKTTINKSSKVIKNYLKNLNKTDIQLINYNSTKKFKSLRKILNL